MYILYAEIIGLLSNWLYSYILIILLLGAGIFFTVKTKFIQFRYLKESIRVVKEPKDDDKSISSFQALMVSTASRVGTGNIAGISTALCIGGPAYYIQAVLKKRWIGILFAVVLIVTYMGGFNMVAAFNIADTFKAYSFYDASMTPKIVGGVLAIAFLICIFGGGKQISKVTGVLVPVMGVFYIAVSLFIVITHINLVPGMIADIVKGAFDFKAIFGGFAGSAIMQGIKRGLFSNEAGVGSAPNAAASAGVSHPAKQGLVQMLSVYIDTIVICTATAFMLLCSGVEPSKEIAGMSYVQAAVANSLGGFGTIFITVALCLFAFTTLIGNFYYAEMGLGYICNKTPGSTLIHAFRILAAVIVCFGATMEFSVAWDTADVLMGLMAIINLPVIILLAKPAILCMDDYIKQKRAGKNPVFKAADINLEDDTDFWK